MSDEKLIKKYKDLYAEVSNHKGARYQVMKKLQKLINDYSIFINQIKNDEYLPKYKFEEKIKEIDSFISETFTNEKIIDFFDQPHFA